MPNSRMAGDKYRPNNKDYKVQGGRGKNAGNKFTNKDVRAMRDAGYSDGQIARKAKRHAKKGGVVGQGAQKRIDNRSTTKNINKYDPGRRGKKEGWGAADIRHLEKSGFNEQQIAERMQQGAEGGQSVTTGAQKFLDKYKSQQVAPTAAPQQGEHTAPSAVQNSQTQSATAGQLAGTGQQPTLEDNKPGGNQDVGNPSNKVNDTSQANVDPRDPDGTPTSGGAQQPDWGGREDGDGGGVSYMGGSSTFDEMGQGPQAQGSALLTGTMPGAGSAAQDFKDQYTGQVKDVMQQYPDEDGISHPHPGNGDDAPAGPTQPGAPDYSTSDAYNIDDSFHTKITGARDSHNTTDSYNTFMEGATDSYNTDMGDTTDSYNTDLDFNLDARTDNRNSGNTTDSFNVNTDNRNSGNTSIDKRNSGNTSIDASKRNVGNTSIDKRNSGNTSIDNSKSNVGNTSIDKSNFGNTSIDSRTDITKDSHNTYDYTDNSDTAINSNNQYDSEISDSWNTNANQEVNQSVSGNYNNVNNIQTIYGNNLDGKMDNHMLGSAYINQMQQGGLMNQGFGARAAAGGISQAQDRQPWSVSGLNDHIGKREGYFGARAYEANSDVYGDQGNWQTPQWNFQTNRKAPGEDEDE